MLTNLTYTGTDCTHTGFIHVIDYGQYQPVPYVPTWTVPVAPTECSEGVHVFPCARCNVCKCGKAERK